jgi:hypothetical protein
LNKKQEALRRGLRSFIEDTSRELADLEGRELQPSPDPATPAGSEARVVGPEEVAAPQAGGSTVSVPHAAAPATREPLITPERVAPSVAPAPPSPIDALAGASRPGVPEPRADGVSDRAPGPGTASRIDADRPPPARPAPPKESLPEGVERSRSVEHRGPEHSPEVTTARDGDPARLRRPAKSARRAAVPVRRRPPRAGADIASNGVSAEQAHARKGVCFAYFLNHECWRVPDAYCITALQVCITRECPVYHLHKDALERRFARKFKHFW